MAVEERKRYPCGRSVRRRFAVNEWVMMIRDSRPRASYPLAIVWHGLGLLALITAPIIFPSVPFSER